MSFISSVTSYFYSQPIKAKSTGVPVSNGVISSEAAPNHICLPGQGNGATVEKTPLACRPVSTVDESHSLLAHPEYGDEPLTGEQVPKNRASDDRDGSDVVVATGQSSECPVSYDQWLKTEIVAQNKPNPKCTTIPVADTASEVSDESKRGVLLLKSVPKLSEHEFISHVLAYNIKHGHKVKLPDSSGELRSFRALQVKGSNIEEGLNAFVLCPTKLPKDGRPLDVKLVFRGTKDMPSVIRDMETDGAGSETIQKAVGDIHDSLNTVLMNLQKKRPNSPVNLQIDGHSLGGADTQNYFAYFFQQIIRQRQPDSGDTLAAELGFEDVKYAFAGFDCIKNIEVFTKNSAGVPKSTQDRLKNSLREFKALNPSNKKTFDDDDNIGLTITHMRVDGDVVQDTSDCHIGADILPDDAEVRVVYIQTAAEASYFKRHTGKYLGGKQKSIPHSVKVLSNKTREGVEKVSRHITKVPETLLHNRSIKKAQYVVHSFAHRFYNLLPGMR